MTNQAVLYARFSPTARKDPQTLVTQFESMRAYCAAMGFEVEGEYSDERLSGADDESRPGLRAALLHVHQIHGTLVIYKIDRLARNTLDSLQIAEDLEKRKCTLVSICERVDTTTPSGKACYTIMAAVAQMLREDQAIRTRDAMIAVQNNGGRVTSKATIPYGHRLDPDDPTKMVPDESEQEVIDKIVHLYISDGLSMRAICERLDEQGIRRRNGSSWIGGHSQIKRCLARRGVLPDSAQSNGK
jgi:site-specific DNA recombinase